MVIHGRQESRNSMRTINVLLLIGAAVTGILLFGAFAVRLHPYTMDDSYISYRYASNFASGHGLTFNSGEFPRSEGITSPLYALFLAPAALFDLDMEAYSKILGLTACLLSALLAGMALYRLVRQITDLSSWNGILVAVFMSTWLLSNPYLVGNAVSGMETALGGLAVSVFLLMLVRQLIPAGNERRRSVVPLGLAALLVPMFRPEMGLFVLAIFGGSLCLCRDSRVPLMKSLGLFLSLGTIYFGLRYYYYGLPLPLPFYIKHAAAGLPGRLDAADYLKHAFLLIPPACLSVSFALGSGFSTKRNETACLLVLSVGIALQLAYYCTIMHIMGFGFRFFMPVTAGFSILAFAGLSIVFDLLIRSKWSRVFSVPCLATFVYLLLIGANISSYDGARNTFLGYVDGMKRYDEIARSIREAADGAELRIAINDCGIIPYRTGFETIDLAGLSNREIALRGNSDATRNELLKGSPHFVFLLSTRPHDRDALFGWERLAHSDMVALGYEYSGAINADSGELNPPDDCCYLAVYTRTQAISVTRPILDRLIADGMMEPPQVLSLEGKEG